MTILSAGVMDNPPSRLIQRKENVAKAAALAKQVFQSRSEGTVKPCPIRIELTGQEIFEDSGGDDQAQISSSTDAQISSGDPIFVLWENHIWYAAICISINHQRVEYRWLDPGNYAEIGSTHLNQIRRRIVGSFEIPAGTLIYVKWSEDNNWYRARFRSKRANNVHFEWDGEYHGDWEATGTVESSHIRIMIDEAQAIRLDPMLLPSEDAVRRFTKDTSTSMQQESQAPSTRSTDNLPCLSCFSFVTR